jgi:hypothetical protein
LPTMDEDDDVGVLLDDADTGETEAVATEQMTTCPSVCMHDGGVVPSRIHPDVMQQHADCTSIKKISRAA